MTKKQQPKNKQQPKTQEAVLPPLKKPSLSWFFTDSFSYQAIFIAALGFIFYFNSIWNEYAFDDGLVIAENKWVQQGFSGIGDIMTHGELDAFYEKYGSKEQFSGGRYRPLSIVTFAIEHELFGENPHVRHFVNVVLYLLTLVLMLYLLRRYVFPGNKDIAFLATLLFAIHPVHSEVIANIKNRSELLALLFYLLMFIYAFRYVDSKKILDIVLASVFLFLSLLSKEYGVLMVVLLPMAFILLRKQSFTNALLYSLPFFGVMAIYLFLRFDITQSKVAGQATTEVLNNQYIIATFEQKITTKIYVLMKYLWVLIFPHPLAADYSFNQIPFLKFSDWRFWASAFLHMGIGVLALVWLRRKPVLAFFLFFYLGHLFLISNLVIEIGTTFGERVIYVASFGFCVIAAYYVLMLLKRWIPQLKTGRPVLIGLLAVVTIVCGYKVIERNAIWKNDVTLFLHDVEVSGNSVLVLGNAGKDYLVMAEKPENAAIKDSLLRKSVKYNSRAVEIHPGFFNGHLNLGLAQALLKQYPEAEASLKKAQAIYPNHPRIPVCFKFLSDTYLNDGINLGTVDRKYDAAIVMMQKAAEWNPDNPDIYYNLGGAYFTIQDYPKAKEMWDKTVQLNPNNADMCYSLGQAYSTLGDFATARAMYNRTLELNPDHPEAGKRLAELPQ